MRASKEASQKKALKHQLNLRKVEQNIAFRNQKDIKCELLLTEGTYQRLLPYKAAPEVRLYPVEDEEEKDCEALKLFVKQHKKLFRGLYGKYANCKIGSKAKCSFDELKEQLKNISVAEVMKMFKDNHVDGISNAELTTLIKLINLKANRQHLTTLNFKGFIELFIQVAIYISSKNPGTCMSPLHCVQHLANLFAQVAKSNGDKALYNTHSRDTEELNQLLKNNPDHLLPEGYKVVEEKILTPTYKISYGIQIAESVRASAEILDEILARAFGTHIIEPVMTFERRTKAVATGRGLGLRNGSVAGGRRMRTKHAESLKLMHTSVGKHRHRVNNVKAIVREVVADIVSAVEEMREGSSAFLNKAMRSKIERQQEAELQRKRKEQRRKARAALLKDTLELLKREKEKKDQEAAEQLYTS